MIDLEGIVSSYPLIDRYYSRVSGGPQAEKLWMEWDSDWDHGADWKVLPVWVSERLAQKRYGKDVNHDFISQLLCGVWPGLWVLLAKCFGPRKLDLVAFSRLAAGEELKPHKHSNPGHLIFHMGVVIPEGDVGLRTGFGEHKWESPGDWVLFDDNHTHSAWNHSDGERVIFYIDLIP